MSFDVASFLKKIISWFLCFQRGGTMNGEICSVSDQIEEIMNCTSFVTWKIRGKSKLCIYTNHSLSFINLHEQQANKVQYLDFAKN